MSDTDAILSGLDSINLEQGGRGLILNFEGDVPGHGGRNAIARVAELPLSALTFVEANALAPLPAERVAPLPANAN
ncbi:MAG TPA: hypothetical protein PLQ19_05490 [Aeromicrobium sp.]|nr:hypothetical protein [Aeromicrobium sp.]